MHSTVGYLAVVAAALVAMGVTTPERDSVNSVAVANDAQPGSTIAVMDELSALMIANRWAAGVSGCADCEEEQPQCIWLDPDKPHAFIDGSGEFASAGGSFCFGNGDDCSNLLQCLMSAATPEDVPALLNEIETTPPDLLGEWLMDHAEVASYYPAGGAIVLLGCEGSVLAVRHLSRSAVEAVELAFNSDLR